MPPGNKRGGGRDEATTTTSAANGEENAAPSSDGGGSRGGRGAGGGDTVIVGPGKHGSKRNVYVRCDSSGPFEMPPATAAATPSTADGNSAGVENDGGGGGDEFQDCCTDDDDKDATSAPTARARSNGETTATTATATTALSSAADSHANIRRKTITRKLSASEVNATLNLNLGLPISLATSPHLRRLTKLLSNISQLFEDKLFYLWDKLPLRFRQQLTKIGWMVYFPLHKLILGRRTGIHPDASYEYHALTTLMWWGNLFPVTIRRMRWSLSQLPAVHPPEAYPPCLKRHGESHSESGRSGSSSGSNSKVSSSNNSGGEEMEEVHDTVVKTIRYDMGDTCQLAKGIARNTQSVVTGYYVQHGPKPSEKVLLWLYGGAYLSGDSRGNIELAEKIAQRCSNMDVFLPDYRLIPEYEFFDSHHDVVQAYEYLISVRGVDPENVMLLGVSSGGGLVVRLLQTIAERRREMEEIGDGGSNIDDAGTSSPEEKIELERLLRNPAGGVLMCPFVDYTEPKGTFKEYIAHDLIVNQSVFEKGIPYFERLGGAETRHNESPVHRSFQGLPPLCVVVSEHECVYDQCELLVNNARSDGVQVQFGVWRYMCHVFPMLSMFIPEGRQAIDFMVEWIRQNQSDHRILGQV